MFVGRREAGLPPLPALTTVSHHPGVVVHCTGGSARPQALSDGLARAKILHASHTRERGWAYAGYHFLVLPEGAVVELRGFGVRGAHARGYNRWLGVAVLGDGEVITPAERIALLEVIDAHVARGGQNLVIPHNAVSRKRCPGPAVTRWIYERWPAPPEAA